MYLAASSPPRLPGARPSKPSSDKSLIVDLNSFSLKRILYSFVCEKTMPEKINVNTIARLKRLSFIFFLLKFFRLLTRGTPTSGFPSQRLTFDQSHRFGTRPRVGA